MIPPQTPAPNSGASHALDATTGGPPCPPVRSALGSSVSSDLEALRNDVEQAKALAGEYQSQLAGKSNEHAILKRVFEQTRSHLVQLQQGITRLREERHSLANEAMKSAALELKLQKVNAECSALRKDLLDSQSKLSAASDRIGDLTLQLQRLRRHPARTANECGSEANSHADTNSDVIAVPFFAQTQEAKVTIISPQVDAETRFRRRTGLGS